MTSTRHDPAQTYYHSREGYNVSTDMGGCVEHHNCTNEDALLAVKAVATREGIPLRYFQWDDWAPLDWNWPPEAFQDGASHWLGHDPHNPTEPMPLSLYHGLYSGSGRVPSLQKYKWSPDGAVPLDRGFFDGIFRNGSKAGMKMFEQDYICSSMATTSTDLGMGRAWFEALDAAAGAAGVDVQLVRTSTRTHTLVVPTLPC